LSGFPQLEFHRAGIGLVPDPGSGPDTAIYIAEAPGNQRAVRSCTCAAARRRTCDHLRELAVAMAELERRWPRFATAWEDLFNATAWCRLARLLQASAPQPCATLRVRQLPADGGLQFLSPEGEELACWLDSSPAALRLLERTGKVAPGPRQPEAPDGGPAAAVFDRAGLLDRLARFQITPAERQLSAHGFKTQRQTWEESFWHRLAYHCLREAAEPPGRPGAERADEGQPGAGHAHPSGGPLDGAGTFHPAVEIASGRFTLTFRCRGAPLARCTVPRGQVEAVLRLLVASFPGQEDLAVSPLPLRSILHVSADTRFDRPEVEVRPAIQAIQSNGEARYFARDDRYRYGNLVFLPELGVLATLERPGQERKFRAPAHLKLSRCEVAAFLDTWRDEVATGYVVLDEPLRGQRIWKRFDAVAVSGEALARGWRWLGLRYGFGADSVALADLQQARRDGLPYLETSFGWIDLSAPAFEHLDRLPAPDAAAPVAAGAANPAHPAAAYPADGAADAADNNAEDGQSTDASGSGADRSLPLVELLRLQASSGVPVAAAGDGAPELARLLELRPAAPAGRPAGLRSPLRQYQEIGADWLAFLYENRLGGLLCDDMGLGKTHQVMALMLSLVERGASAAPFLVVCPTSVASHWRNKLRDHAPGLQVLIHHGSQRGLPERLGPGEVVVTSYGILRRDAAELGRRRFALAVFDEAQHLKNPETQSYRAAARLDALLRVGLSGTPIENSLADLKALLDLVLPGYLGSDRAFEERYLRRPLREARRAGEPGAGGGGSGGGMLELGPAAGTGAGVGEAGDAAQPGIAGAAAAELAVLRRLVAPFVLRRSKSAVLAELPEKIEDLRSCLLSADQVKLYRDAIAGRGAALARELEAASGPPPFIHIFALLNLLKQICDHPALALGRLEEADAFASGKWDLYREVIEECLGSGLKVVVFTQYLGMIRLMQRHLDGLGASHVVLTGASGGTEERGARVDRFNHDPACRVFLGSLKAGGTGIDLIGGSVVIHYDRWWNAAREDQATDRVHRIGQRRAVQVIKLITEGTLEEKIAAIIERKRALLGAVVPDEDPGLAKTFTRDELLDLLRWSPVEAQPPADRAPAGAGNAAEAAGSAAAAPAGG
jgi:superfamily II DNA or RNA helicase